MAAGSITTNYIFVSSWFKWATLYTADCSYNALQAFNLSNKDIQILIKLIKKNNPLFKLK